MTNFNISSLISSESLSNKPFPFFRLGRETRFSFSQFNSPHINFVKVDHCFFSTGQKVAKV